MCEDILCTRGDKITSYIIYTFANSCMPTLMKLKPASLVSFLKRYIPDRDCFLTQLNKELNQFDGDYEVLYENDTTYCILVYNKEMLKEIFQKYCNHPIMKDNGYRDTKEDINYNLNIFKNKFTNFKIQNNHNFPHEVGILLGYPIIDVEEYIKNNGENYILCSYWKIYHNVEEAMETIQYFKQMRINAINLFFNGKDLKELQLSA